MKITHCVYPTLLLVMTWGCSSGARVEPTTSVATQGAIVSLSFSPSGSVLTTAGGAWDTTVTLRDTTSLNAIRSIPVPERVQAIAFSPDGKTIAVADGDYQGLGHAYLFDPATGDRLKTIGGSTGWIHGLAFSPDGALLVTCGSTWIEDATGQGYKRGEVAACGLRDGQERAVLESEGGTCRAVAFSPNGKTYITGGGTCFLGRPDSGDVRLWDTETGQNLWSRQGHSQLTECVAFAPNGEVIASGGMDGELKLWAAADGQELFEARLGNKRYGRVLSIAFAPDGKYLISAFVSHNRGNRFGELRAWDVGTKPIQGIPFFDGPSPMTCIAFSRDGRLLAAGDAEGILRVWQSAKVFVVTPER
jgi:WD40 repeat protein